MTLDGQLPASAAAAEIAHLRNLIALLQLEVTTRREEAQIASQAQTELLRLLGQAQVLQAQAVGINLLDSGEDGVVGVRQR